jgi:hypothetical protein
MRKSRICMKVSCLECSASRINVAWPWVVKRGEGTQVPQVCARYPVV